MRECIGAAATIRRQSDDLLRRSPNRTRHCSPGTSRTRMLRLLLASLLVVALSALFARSASAQANWTGLTSNDWMAGGNWTTAAPPIPGQTVNIEILGAPPQRETILGVGGPFSVSVGTMSIGNSGATAGNLTIQNGSTLTSTGSSRIGISAGSTGIVTVTGPGSRWNVTAGTFYVGFLRRRHAQHSKWRSSRHRKSARSWAATPRLPARSTSVAAACCKLNRCGAAPARARPISTMASCGRLPATRPSSTDFRAPSSTSSRAG